MVEKKRATYAGYLLRFFQFFLSLVFPKKGKKKNSSESNAKLILDGSIKLRCYRRIVYRFSKLFGLFRLFLFVIL